MFQITVNVQAPELTAALHSLAAAALAETAQYAAPPRARYSPPAYQAPAPDQNSGPPRASSSTLDTPRDMRESQQDAATQPAQTPLPGMGGVAAAGPESPPGAPTAPNGLVSPTNVNHQTAAPQAAAIQTAMPLAATAQADEHQTAVPVAPPPAYTRDQITKAGAELIDENKMPELLGLLERFGVQAVTQVPVDQLGAFAAALREIGGKI